MRFWRKNLLCLHFLNGHEVSPRVLKKNFFGGKHVALNQSCRNPGMLYPSIQRTYLQTISPKCLSFLQMWGNFLQIWQNCPQIWLRYGIVDSGMPEFLQDCSKFKQWLDIVSSSVTIAFAVEKLRLCKLTLFLESIVSEKNWEFMFPLRNEAYTYRYIRSIFIEFRDYVS